MAQTTLPPSSITDLTPTVTPGQPVVKLINPPLPPGLVGPPPTNVAAVNSVVVGIQAAIAADALANTSGTTPAPAPDNFRFTDLTVNVSSTTPGDVFKGAVAAPEVKTQFIDLTPDTLNITAVSPNVFIKTDSGNDIVAANSGRNILSVGGGINTTIGGTGHDTTLADATKGLTFASLLNFGSGDDVAMLGVNATDFTFTLTDSLFGLEIDANPNPIAPGATPRNAAEIVLQGYRSADIGTKLTLGISTSVDGATPFLFVHAT
jgi:hypothetical protein